MNSYRLMAVVLLSSGLSIAQEPSTPTTPRFFPAGSVRSVTTGPKSPPKFFPSESPPDAKRAPVPVRPRRPAPFTPTATTAAQAAVPVAPATAETPIESSVPVPDPTVRLPYPEQKLSVGSTGVRLDRRNGGWVLVAGRETLHDFGQDRQTAEAAARTVRGLRATEWGRIGSPRTVVEYGLVDGAPPKWTIHPPAWLPVDRKSLRAERVRGTWVVRDAANILLNVGPNQADAEQAVAVARRYGFNRLALVGFPTPAMAIFFAGPVVIGDNGGGSALARVAQEKALTRTGLDVPGLGYVGERLAIDPHAVEYRKDGSDWVLAHGPDVLAWFGRGELAARDAVRAVKDGRFTEFCRVGGATFFLADGAAPTRVPFGVRGQRFHADGLRVAELDGRWDVLDSGNRMAGSALTRAEAEELVRVFQAYRFDTRCEIGTGLRFYAKTGR